MVEALDAIQATSEGLLRNPNETLQFQALFLRLAPPADAQPNLSPEMSKSRRVG
jgi:hypothetical protein